MIRKQCSLSAGRRVLRPVERTRMLFWPRVRKRKFYAIVAALALLLLLTASAFCWMLDPRLAPLPWLAAAAALAYGVLWERRWVETTRRTVTLPGLPESMDGFRIVHLSDLHWDAYTRPEWMRRTFDRVNALEPDIIVLTGDLITHFREYIEPCARGLGHLRARHGVFAVLGNHDHWASGRLLTEALEASGITVLNNAHRPIGDGLWLVGVDDPHLQRADLNRALEGVADDGRPRVLLAHSPDIMEEAADRVDLVLSGHTHGGQVRLPVLGAIMRVTRRPAARPFTVGWGRAGRTLCFTNRGLGSVLIPIRFNCRPEIAVITLKV